MAEYLNKELFLRSMGLVGDETKYGNRDGEHQSRSYSTWMGYEIMGSVEDSVVEEDVVPVVRCKDCKHENCHHALSKPSDKRTWCDYWAIDPLLDDFCSYGERREGND